ncbi:colanic acid biosynthesis glycosyltransferase WcaL [Legionella beliardensis]|uniref:Colanic acid biosynthesis glycosyltransferase WcaL n=1 Tax=Legionella beliardensis TaxID=91822 RepID=A0A378I5F1_9GAMM|nr:glycosyltransferase [Legionella beliardensis]STX27704.1 colanic acid biosynthesis glycosyltransferase WcaL [Legionella beliardensis]
MKLLLISTRMGTAGVETLLLRMAKFLSEKGFHVDVLLMREVDVDSANQLRQYANLYIGWKFRKLNDIFSKLGKDYYHCIYTFSFFPLIYTLYIKQKFFPSAKICFGVYHPYEYCWSFKSKTKLAKFAAEIIQNFPAENVFFMNQGMKDRHTEKLQHDFSLSPIIPVPVDVNSFQNAKRNFAFQTPYKIVSIGRITDFKTYNFTMIEVMAALIQEGLAVEYHIYGDGELLPRLQQLIQHYKLQDYVFLHGPVPYTLFSSVLEDAFLFVGVGTALVEAAACKLPCLQGIEMDKKAESYGFFHELTGYNLGEKNTDQPRYKMVDLIKQLMNYSEDAYREASYLSYKRSLDFAIDSVIKTFLDSLQGAKIVDYKVNHIKLIYMLLNAIFLFVCRRANIATSLDNRYVE